jgi:Flp pilus assembly protein TadG
MYASRERGAAAVEFALIVPLLILFLFGIVEGGTRYTQQNQVNHWAFLTARDLSIDPTKSADSIVASLKGTDTNAFTVSVTPSAVASRCTSTTNNQITVTITSLRTSVSGMFGSYTLNGKGVARCES